MSSIIPPTAHIRVATRQVTRWWKPKLFHVSFAANGRCEAAEMKRRLDRFLFFAPNSSQESGPDIGNSMLLKRRTSYDPRSLESTPSGTFTPFLLQRMVLHSPRDSPTHAYESSIHSGIVQEPERLARRMQLREAGEIMHLLTLNYQELFRASGG